MNLSLGDFATDALSAKHGSVSISISYSRLFNILERAEGMVANLGPAVLQSTRVTRKRKLSSSSAEELLSDDEASFAGLEKAAMDRADRNDEDFEERPAKRSKKPQASQHKALR